MAGARDVIKGRQFQHRMGDTYRDLIAPSVADITADTAGFYREVPSYKKAQLRALKARIDAFLKQYSRQEREIKKLNNPDAMKRQKVDLGIFGKL